MPESMHMLLWAMSDRTLPRSLRMMEGFGVHTFRLVNADGKSTFVKFHWRPKIGSATLIWDESVKLYGADPDSQRRDLFDAIAMGDFPELEFSVQAFDEKTAAKFPFDVLDATKLIPEEMVPLTPLGRMVLDRNPDNFFAETEQSAFHPGHVVPGIDFTDDPLLQGRLFSYTDTQLIRLGGANFHELPINRPKCPMQNFQRDGVRRMDIPKGQVAYEPNSIAPDGPRADPDRGFTTFPALDAGDKVRERSETFADHYSQPRLFYRSMSEPEQRHIVNAFTFELSKVSRPNIRQRMLGHLKNIDADLFARVEDGLGMQGQAEDIKPARAPIDMKPSPALSLVKKAPKTLEGRKVGVLVTDGSDPGVRHCVANGRGKGRRAAAGRRTEDRRRQGKRRQGDRCRSSARRRTVDLLRCRRRCGVDRRRLDAREGGRGDRLDSRRVRTPQGDRGPRLVSWSR